MVAGDMLMFLMGRYTGWWLLGVLCRISLNPESCILRSADSFYRRGRTLLVVAKFIPGINTMAPPLAGCMNMPLLQFLALDLAGAALYTGSYFAVGFLFSDALGAITRRLPDVRRWWGGLFDLSGRRVRGLPDLAMDQGARAAYRSVRDPFRSGAAIGGWCLRLRRAQPRVP